MISRKITLKKGKSLKIVLEKEYFKKNLLMFRFTSSSTADLADVSSNNSSSNAKRIFVPPGMVPKYTVIISAFFFIDLLRNIFKTFIFYKLSFFKGYVHGKLKI